MNHEQIRPAVGADLNAILALNEGAVPNVNSIPLETLEKFLHQAAYFRLIDGGDRVAAFLVAFAPGADYESENYRWFSARYPEFMYIDRVAVAPDQRGRGLALHLYRDLEQATSAPLLACEVNLEPPNPRSLEFHRRFGFKAVGSQQTEGGAKTVSLMIKPLAGENT